MDMYGHLFRSVLFPAWEAGVRRRRTLAHLDALERTQWCSAEELAALQLEALRALLRHAYDHVPFYRRRMRAVGIEPSDIRSHADLLRIPSMTRAEASASNAERRSTAAPFPDIEKATSGSSGRPLVFGYDRGSEEWRQAVKLRGLGWSGYRLGDRTLHYWGPQPKPLPPLLKRAKISVDRAIRRETYLDCTRRDEGYLHEVVSTIRRERPRTLMCFAQSAGQLARFINARGLRDWDDIGVVCGAEQLFPQDRAALERAFGKGVFETYGSREVMLMAAECEAHAGLHVSMENIIIEIVVRDPDGRERHARPGEQGEVVVTDLHNFGMPFVRYVNGDMAKAGPNEQCGCGRWLQRLATIEGRKTDTLIDGAGSSVAGLLVNVCMVPVAAAVREFQCIQHKDRSITLKLVTTERYTPAIEAQIRENLGSRISGVPITIMRVPEIEGAGSGKRRPVVVE
jgi:phenylacetate-CoA ligase